jgi:hypothetical protein
VRRNVLLYDFLGGTIGFGRAFSVGVAIILAACGRDRRDQVGGEASRAPSPTLSVTILGAPSDPRIPVVREAIAHWNDEAARLSLRVRLDSGTVVNASIPEDALRAASSAMPMGGVGVLRLRAALRDVPGDIVVALSDAELISFGVSTGTGRLGIIGLRPADRMPLSLPNALRNVIAHELGHVLGLEHNADSTTLMCGRPARCRPSAFASEQAHFFPLTAADERRLQERWPSDMGAVVTATSRVVTATSPVVTDASAPADPVADSASVALCATPPGGIRVSADTVAGLPTGVPISELDQRCPSDSVDDYGIGGYTGRARIFSFTGATISAVQSDNESSLDLDEVADLWSAKGDSIRLPDGRLMPKTIGALRAAYPNGLISSDKSDDSDGVLAYVCDFPRLVFTLNYDSPTPADTGHWRFAARAVADSTTIYRIEVWPEKWWHTTAGLCAKTAKP